MWSDRRGGAVLLIALLALPLIAGMGMAVDATRLYMVQTRLKTAIDAGALIAARDINDPARNQNAINLFWANFGRSSPTSTQGYLGTNITAVTVTQVSQNVVAIQANGLMPTTFMGLLGIKNVSVTSSNQATRAATGIELALVLDNTGSMKGWPIQSVVSSATSLVNIVYGNGTQDTQPNLWVSVVPFSAEVSIGPTRTNWLKSGSNTTSAYANGIWRGCVMARYDSTDALTGLTNDFTDIPPIGVGGVPFVPFLYASTLGKYTVTQNKQKVPVTGDDDWSPTNITEDKQVSLSDNTAVGPNLGCPQTAIIPSTGREAPLPVLPLTASRTTVLNTISQMVANFRGGTFINLGLQAGWWTLSPRWRASWNLAATGPSPQNNQQLPLNYNTPFMKKIIVLMTDGNNEWYDWPGGAPGVGPSPWSNDGDTDFTAYGRLSTYNKALGTNYSQSQVTSLLNSKMTQMCTQIKLQGIIIYTILFNHDNSVSSSTQTLFQNCATDPQHYFVDVTAAQLQATFSVIGDQLASLRLSQ